MTIPTVFDPAHSPWRDSLELMLESTGEGIFGIDLNGDCVFINRAGAELLGYEKNAILGQNMHQLTHHSHADGCPYSVEDCPIFNAFRQGLPCRIDSEFFWNSSGRAFPVEYSSYPIMNQGKVLGAVVTFIDIGFTKNPTVLGWDFFLSDRAGSRVLVWVPANVCGLRQPPELAVPGHIPLSPGHSSLPGTGPKSAKATSHRHIDQRVTRGRIKWLDCGIG